MFGALAIIGFVISFVLYWAGKGSAPLDSRGFELLAFICLAVHMCWPVYPWRRP